MKKKIRLVVSLLTFFLLSHTLFSQGGDNAAAAAASPVTLPFSATGTTCGRADNYNFPAFCTCTGGNDWLYYFCAPTSGVIDIFITNAYGVAPALLIYNGVPNASGSTYVASSITGSNINSLVSLTVTAGNCFYVMVDNDPSVANPTASCFNYSITIRYHTTPPAAPLQPACTNIGYDSGSLAGWVGTTGEVTTGPTGAPTPNYNPLYYTIDPQQHVVTSGAGVDPFGGFPVVNPAGGTNSLRLGDLGNFGTTNQFNGGIPGSGGATLEQKFTVTSSNALFVYYYAVVIQDANSMATPHTSVDQPFFKTDVFDCSGNAVACGQYLVVGGPSIPGFTLSASGGNVYYKTWSPVAVDLTPYIGTCVTVRYTVGDCTIGGHFAYAYVDANCSPLAITGVNMICPTKSTVLSAPVGLFTYSWTPGGASTQSITVSPTVTTTYSCELTSYTNCHTSLTYSVSLFPPVTASAVSQTVCNGTSATVTTSVTPAGGSYVWAPGGSTASSISVSPTSTSTYICTYTDLDGCSDTAMSRVTVNPLPVMTVPPSTLVCNAGNVAASSFTSNVAGTTYTWTNSNPTIGLAASGTGNTPAFTGTNSGTTPVTSVVSVTPSANSCVGSPVSYTITVNPIPTVNAITSSTYCNGASAAATPFTGNVASATYSWTNSNTSIGLGASGSGNISAFTAANTGAATSSGVITVTPTAGACVGTPANFTISVNPSPTVSVPPSAAYCTGDVVPASTFTGNVTGTTFNWANSNTSIGLGASGTSTTPSFTTTNTSPAPIQGVVSVTPTANACVGSPQSFTITVNPVPTVNAVTSATYCNGASVSAIVFTGNVPTSVYNWNNSNTSIGLGASGTGNISSFTAANTGASTSSGVITVTPTAGTCIGTPTGFTITVNPVPTVSVPSSAAYCAGDLVPASTFTGNIASAVFNWTNSDPTIGLSASGTGNISSFTAANTGASSLQGIVSVTPTANTCVGGAQSFTITVNPTPAAPTIPAVTICPGSFANLAATAPGGNYSWYDAQPSGNLLSSGGSYTTPNLTVSTTYYVQTTNAFGCVSPFTPITVTVLNNLPVTASPNQTICAGATAMLSVNPSGTGYIYSWDSPSTIGFSSIANPVVSPIATTMYTVHVTSPNGCTGMGQTNVSVNALPVADAGSPVSICSNGSGTIGATSLHGYLYSWSPGTGLSSTSVSDPTVTLPNNGSAPVVNEYTLTVTLNGCQSDTTVQVTVNPLPVSNAGFPLTLCSGQSGNIGSSNTGGYSYAWSPGTNLSSTTVSNPIVSGNAAGSFVYSVTTTEAATTCQSSATVGVTVLPLPTVNAGSAPAVCVGAANIPLAGTIGGSVIGGVWSGGSGIFSPNNTTLTGSYTPTSAEFNTRAVTLTLTAIAITPCQNVSANISINFYDNPVVTYTVNDPKGCPEHCVTFMNHSSISSPETIQSWSWSFGDGASSTDENPSHCYTQPGFYNVSLNATSNHGCSTTSVVPQMVEVYPLPVASFIPDPMTAGILDPNITFQNKSQGAVTYVWDFGDPSTISVANNTSTLTNPTHAYTYSGIYNVNLVATSIHGCVARSSANIEITPEFTFYIPNTFTPGNSDNVNDIFTGMGVGIATYEMWIFDRWGANIFYSNDIHKGWDGRMHGKGDEVKQDVYIWKVKLKDVLGKDHEYIGHVTLLK